MKPFTSQYVSDSPLAWRELVHETFHSQSALEEWHDYVHGFDEFPALIVYDEIRRTREEGMVFVFKPEAMSAFGFAGGSRPECLGHVYYTPGAPDKFLRRVFSRFVSQIQEVDIAELNSYLDEMGSTCLVKC